MTRSKLLGRGAWRRQNATPWQGRAGGKGVPPKSQRCYRGLSPSKSNGQGPARENQSAPKGKKRLLDCSGLGLSPPMKPQRAGLSHMARGKKEGEDKDVGRYRGYRSRMISEWREMTRKARRHHGTTGPPGRTKRDPRATDSGAAGQ